MAIKISLPNGKVDERGRRKKDCLKGNLNKDGGGESEDRGVAVQGEWIRSHSNLLSQHTHTAQR
jgi:hypothetical protein